MTAEPSSPFLSDTPAEPSALPPLRHDDAFEAADLANRLAWFLRLRWGAAAALVLASGLGPALGLTWLWPALLLLGLAVLAYNAACRVHLTRTALSGDDALFRLRVSAIVQIGLDLAALLMAAHLTGGLASPLLPFFGFHMAIGTIVLSTEVMYVAAGMTSLAALGLHVLETGGLTQRYSIEAGLSSPEAAMALGLLAFVGFLFIIVYLTGSVSDRLKQRNDDLRRASEALRERSAELQRLLAEVAELERRKSHYMRISAHQLRSPLGTVRTTLDVLTGGFVDLTSERARHLMRGAADRVTGLLQMVNGLLDLAKVREGAHRAPWTRSVNLNQLTTDLLDSLTPFGDERGVRLVSDFAEPVVLEWGVPPDLIHALENLIHNAIKYSQPGGEVVVRLSAAAGLAIVRVEDKGIGVPEPFREQLFLEFVRAPNARAHAPEGTGLGLALVREVAAAHGGRVVLEDRPVPGATFRLEIPLHAEPPEALRPLQPGNAPGYSPETRRRPPRGARRATRPSR